MEILGLDKIKQVDEDVSESISVTGLDKIVRIEEEVAVTGLDKIKQIFHNDLPKMSSFATELISLVNRAKELDRDCRQFGAEKHRYEFNPVVPLSQVRDFEQRHKITLPQEYVDFLTQVGNGGAGPDYGIYSLEEAEQEAYYDHSNSFCHHELVKSQPDYYTLPYALENQEPMVNAQLTEDKWNKWYSGFIELGDSGRETEADEMYKQAYNGLLQIIDSGCCTGYMLVCHGDMSGQLVMFRHELEYPVPVNQTFEDFVLSHFKGMIAKLEKND